MSTSLPQVMTDAERGIIPADLTACAALIALCNRFEQTAANVRWMTIARAKELHDDPSSWIAWVMQKYPAYGSKSMIHHSCAVGHYLLRHAKSAARSTLFSLSFNKLFALMALRDDRLDDFLDGAPKRYGKPVEQMSREEIREAVALWNTGKPMAPAAPPPRRPLAAAPVQVDFLDALFAATGEEVRAFHRRVQERALTVDDALPILNRAFAVVDVMIGRLDRRRPEAFAALAKDFRNEAARLEKMLADPGIVSPVRPLSPPPELASPEDAVRRRLPAVAKQE